MFKKKLSGLIPLLSLIAAGALSGMKWGLVLVLVFTLLSVAAAVWYAFCFKKQHPLLVQTCGLLVIACLYRTLLYNYVEEGIHFWLFPAVMAGGVGAVALVLALKKRLPFIRDRLGERIGAVVLAVFLAWVCGWFTMNHLNYILDPSQPQYYEGEILEKNSHYRYRKPDTYSLTVAAAGGEQRFTVSKTTYDRAEEGDILVYRCYEGAFDTPYYQTYLIEKKGT